MVCSSLCERTGSTIDSLSSYEARAVIELVEMTVCVCDGFDKLNHHNLCSTTTTYAQTSHFLCEQKSACAKLSLYLSKSYSTKLEDLVNVSETAPDGTEKTQVELLIDRIQKIQEELPSHTTNEAEEAFTEAAEQNNLSFWGETQKQNRKLSTKKSRR